jgi:hypothetical protein
MKKGLKIIAILVIGFITLYFSYLAYTGYSIKNSDAYKVALSSIENNTLIQSKTGGIVGYGTFPSGSITENDAVLIITVKGKKTDAKVIAMLTKLSGNQWRLYQLINGIE